MFYTAQALGTQHLDQLTAFGSGHEAVHLAVRAHDHVVGAFHGDKLIGYSHWTPTNAKGHCLAAIRVQDDHRGQGAGGSMCDYYTHHIAPRYNGLGPAMEHDIDSKDVDGIAALKRDGWTAKSTWAGFTLMTRPLGKI